MMNSIGAMQSAAKDVALELVHLVTLTPRDRWRLYEAIIQALLTPRRLPRPHGITHTLDKAMSRKIAILAILSESYPVQYVDEIIECYLEEHRQQQYQYGMTQWAEFTTEELIQLSVALLATKPEQSSAPKRALCARFAKVALQRNEEEYV